MNRTFRSFHTADSQQAKLKMLNWANRFNICCFLDSHQYPSSGNSIEVVAAAGVLHEIRCNAGNAFNQLFDFHSSHRDWIFGHLAYDLKNETENLQSVHSDLIGFPDLYFFIPRIIVFIRGDEVVIGMEENEHEKVFLEIMQEDITWMDKRSFGESIHFTSRFSHEEYIQTIRELQNHILKGDCYEINLCQEFFAEGVQIDPVQVFHALCQVSPNPFASFYRLNGLYCLCASPERYLKKEGERIFSQPIKGTVARAGKRSDAEGRLALRSSTKDRSENVMIVDLVRNDLSKVCREGSVRVEELFGIYTFPQVHQMISTVSGILREGIPWVEAIRASFPMGSMTGAPKLRVMQLIEKYERSRRGLFSGSIGYIDPSGDFDFNVVIRSIFYNQECQALSFLAGSAITYYSVPELEYQECLLKVRAIKKVLTDEISTL